MDDIVNAVPAEFKAMARNIAADTFDFVNSMNDLVAAALIGIDQHQAAAIRPFLTTVLAKNIPADDLSAFWSAMPSGIHMSNGDGVREFLESLLSALEQEPYLTGLQSD